ncbi:MAG TPA: triose-phosphate isomerase [Thermomicrobiales bacterium]|jgi:triosephosphate isomerase (TIM)|nr:triose-phosphate isomerase [Thermomicrobiales bacterium]
MTQRRLVLGNWKMNTTLEEAVEIADHLRDEPIGEGVTVGIAPPFPWLQPVKQALGKSGVLLGAQTFAAASNGAFTGEVSAAMVAELCDFALIGHSERRALHGETDDVVREKLLRALEVGLMPVVCVGETLAERMAGDQERVVLRQIHAVLEGIENEELHRLVIAYEPVWAIGTGQTASPQDASAMCGLISVALTGRKLMGIPVLYGGSVTAANAASLIAEENISGFLVGGASLKPDDFLTIVRAAQV